jgi:hypothetical protein
MPLHRTASFLLASEVMMGNTIFILILGGGMWLAIALVRSASKRQEARRQVALASWQHAVQTCATYEQFRLAQVLRVTERYPRRGTKAWLRWHGSDERQDAWFAGAFPPSGAWVVVSGSDGYGPHTKNPRIFYVHKVHDVIVF